MLMQVRIPPQSGSKGEGEAGRRKVEPAAAAAEPSGEGPLRHRGLPLAEAQGR